MPEPDLLISGGAGGTDAQLEDLRTLSRLSEERAATYAAVSARCHGALVDPDLLASAVLDPAAVARIEAALLAAVDGPAGLTWLSGELTQQALALRATAYSYEAVEAAQAEMLDIIRWTSGVVAFAGLPVLAPTLLATGAGYVLAGGEIDAEALLTDHPGVVEGALGGGAGVLSVLTGLPLGDVSSAARLISLFYPDAVTRAASLGADDADIMRTPPGGIGDLLAGLDHRNTAADQADHIDIRTITAADGRTAYIVDIPGTKVMNLPGTSASTANDMSTNIHILGGEPTMRQQAVADALRQAGVGPNDPVMLVGHSQGGMLAAHAASQAGSAAFPYNVTHVVTAGSPIARTEIPPHVQVLALENSRDIVPRLDTRDNPDRHNVTTVVADHQHRSIDNNHGMGTTYVPLGRQLDESRDPSVQAFRDSAGAFLGGARSQAQVFTLWREP